MNQTMKQTIYKGLCVMEILCYVGLILYIVGTAGAFENDAISASTFCIRLLISFILLFIL